MSTSQNRAPWPGSIWVLAFLAWTLLGLLSFAQGVAFRVVAGQAVDWYPRLPIVLADWLTCGLCTPVTYWMVRRFPVQGHRWWSALPPHLAVSVAFVFVKNAVYVPILQALLPSLGATYMGQVIRGAFPDLLGYWGATGVMLAIDYYRQAQERTLIAAKLDGELRAAELENLKAQLQPHFLFNTLQAISTLIHRDPGEADRVLANLSELLRLSIRHSAAQEVPLRDELGFLTRYLDIMRARFGDRLAIELQVDDSVMDAMVPSLVLQPLAENAIRHGMADRGDRGNVWIRGRRDGDSLVLEVADDGPGLAARPGGDGNGIGLANTRGRLQRLYGAAHAIEVKNGQERRGLVARLKIPYRERREPEP